MWEFHTAFGQVRNTVPTLPGSETLADPNSLRSLRKRLLEEEYNEYVEGEDNNDLVEIADAIADILYIAYGTAVSYGLPMDEIFNEVHASNMSKLGEDGKPIYREDGKILKGPNFFQPDILSIIKRAEAVGFEAPSDTVIEETEGKQLPDGCYEKTASYSGVHDQPFRERFVVYIGTAHLPYDRAMTLYNHVKTDFLAQVKEANDPGTYYFVRVSNEEMTRVERI